MGLVRRDSETVEPRIPNPESRFFRIQ